MTTRSPRSWRSLLLGALVIGALVPVAALPTALAVTCEDKDEPKRYISVGSPLSEQLTAGEVLWLLVVQPNPILHSLREEVNGIDAFVFDLNCESKPGATFCVTGADGGNNLYDFGAAFYSTTLSYLGTTNVEGSPDICPVPPAQVPANTRYLVLFLTAGAPIVGVTPITLTDGLPRPYSAEFFFTYRV